MSGDQSREGDKPLSNTQGVKFPDLFSPRRWEDMFAGGLVAAAGLMVYFQVQTSVIPAHINKRNVTLSKYQTQTMRLARRSGVVCAVGSTALMGSYIWYSRIKKVHGGQSE